MRRARLEYHAVCFLADLAQSLVIVADAGAEAAEHPAWMQRDPARAEALPSAPL